MLHRFSRPYIVSDIMGFMIERGSVVMMEVCHTSDVIVEHPDTIHPRDSMLQQCLTFKEAISVP